MRPIRIIFIVGALAVSPLIATAQERPNGAGQSGVGQSEAGQSEAGQTEAGQSLMERGAQMMLDGLMKEMEPALGELKGMAGELEPALRGLAEKMGPQLRDLLAKVDDWSVYEAPEILPNGDIIMRRKVPLVPKDDEPRSGETEI